MWELFMRPNLVPDDRAGPLAWTPVSTGPG
jgi:hypothetical protein